MSLFCCAHCGCCGTKTPISTMARAAPSLRITIVGLNYTPEPIGIGPFSAGLAEALARRGHDVTVLAGVPYYPNWCLHDGYINRKNENMENGVRVMRLPHYIPRHPTAVRRLLHHLSYTMRAMRALKTMPHCDLIIAIAPSLISSYCAQCIDRERARHKDMAPHPRFRNRRGAQHGLFRDWEIGDNPFIIGAHI